MLVLSRVPRFAAYLVTVALVVACTAAVAMGLRTLPPPTPAHLRHAHGLVVVVTHNETFAVRVAGKPGLMWFRLDRDSSISMAHLERHMREQAPTDVAYEVAGSAVALAWTAD
ncbi:MAG: hypothetical protein ACHQ4H_05585 [Ktedonobacterales bacterium]|jgi:hypothetical protein